MKTPSFLTELETIVKSIDIDPEGNISLSGAPYSGNEFADASTEVRVYQQLAQVLYGTFYTRGKPEEAPELPEEEVWAFREQLRAANQSKGGNNDGWLVEEPAYSQEILLRKGGYKRYTYPGDFTREQFGQGPLRPGERVRIQVFSEAGLGDSPDSGFYYVFGDTLLDHNPEMVVRFYFHLLPEGAAPLIAFLSETLNRYQIPFQFKCLNRPGNYHRADAGVLYIDKRYFQICFELIVEQYDRLKPVLKPEIPMFTCLVLPGISFAENPYNPADSFGTSRCRVLAKGIFEAWNQKLPKTEWVSSILNVLEKNYYSPQAFHLNPNSKYPYSELSFKNQ